MSDKWHGGKGDKIRISDYGQYWDNYDNIFKRGEYKRCLFLDDVRRVRDAFLWDENKSLIAVSGISEWKWDIVRSYDEFVKYINTHGIPDVVSFDNDLWNVQEEMKKNPTSEELTRQFQMKEWESLEIKTGAHCAKYLVEKCNDLKKEIPKYYVHSANSTARPIIREILENARNNKHR